MNKFYLTWSNEAPLHPSEVYGLSFETGISWYGQINPENISLKKWRKKLIKQYDALSKQFQNNGKIRKLNWIINPNENIIKQIESRTDFIKWC